MAKQEPEAILWHTTIQEDGGPHSKRLYHLSIHDEQIPGDQKTVSAIVSFRPADKNLEIETFLPHEFNYTVHDACDHEDDYCVLNDPDSSESE